MMLPLRLLLGIAIALSALPAYADATHVVVSQVQVAGDKADDEFIELYNPSTTETSLDGWSLQYRSAGSTKVLKKNFPTGASIAGHSYYLVANSSSPFTAADMLHSSFSMASDGGTVLLVGSTTLLTDLASASVIDKVGYGSASLAEGSPAPAPSAKQSIERKPGGGLGNATDTDNNAGDFFITASHPRSRSSPSIAEPVVPPATTTPSTDTTPPAIPQSGATDMGSPSPSAAPTALPAPSAGSVVLNEVMADPAEGEREWVELISTATDPIALDGATLEDAQGTIATLSGSIGGDTPFVVVPIAATRLNNSGDAVVLKWRDGTVLDRVTYGDENDGTLSDNAPAAPKNASIIRLADGTRSGNDAIDWKITATPTKGSSNHLTAPASGSAPTLASSPDAGNALLLPVGTVRLNEWVSDPPDNGVEWVELINTSRDPVSLAGWMLEEGSGEQTPLSGILGTNDFDRYLVINNPKGALNNAGDRILIRDANKRIMDDVSYGTWGTTLATNAPSTPDPWSVARIPENYTGRGSKDFAVTTTPTPNAANRMTPPAGAPPTAGAMSIVNAVQTVSASGAPPLSMPALPNFPPTVILDAPDEASVKETVIFDASESVDPESKPLTFTWEIEGVVTKTVTAPQFEYMFVNPGKFVVALTVSDGVRKSKLRHHIRILPPETIAAQDGQDAGTPSNGTSDPTQKKKTKNTDSRAVVLDGVVSAPFGIIGARKFAAEPIGIINVTHGDLPDLSIGTRVHLRGHEGNDNSETALNIQNASDITTTGNDPPPPAARAAISDFTDTLAGHVVRTTGDVEAARGKQVTLSADGEQLTVILPTRTKLSSQLFVEGDAIAATGILRKTSAGYALIPRAADDIEWLARAPAPASTNQPQQASGLATSLTTAALAGTLFGLWKLLPRKAGTVISFPEAAQVAPGEKPRPLLLDGTDPEIEEDSIPPRSSP